MYFRIEYIFHPIFLPLPSSSFPQINGEKYTIFQNILEYIRIYCSNLRRLLLQISGENFSLCTARFRPSCKSSTSQTGHLDKTPSYVLYIIKAIIDLHRYRLLVSSSKSPKTNAVYFISFKYYYFRSLQILKYFHKHLLKFIQFYIIFVCNLTITFERVLLKSPSKM